MLDFFKVGIIDVENIFRDNFCEYYDKNKSDNGFRALYISRYRKSLVH
jgi:hypothetical protein